MIQITGYTYIVLYVICTDAIFVHFQTDSRYILHACLSEPKILKYVFNQSKVILFLFWFLCR